MVGYIYLIIDLTNWKKYVGQHHYHLEKLDSNYHGSGHIIKQIYKKRPQTLKEVYLKTCYSQEELDEWEQYYIKFYNTLYPNGYNLTEGGNGGVPCEETRKKISDAHKGKTLSEEHRRKLRDAGKGRHHSEESKKKISDANKEKHRSEETKKKISEVKKKLYSLGENHPMLGKHHSEETRKKMSENHWDCSGENHYMFGKHHSEETKKKISNTKKGIPNEKCSKKILQFTLDDEFVREWSSIAECSRNGYDGANICYCCQGKRKSHKGFKWCYA